MEKIKFIVATPKTVQAIKAASLLGRTFQNPGTTQSLIHPSKDAEIQMISGGYNGAFKIVNENGVYKVINGTGLETSKAFINGRIFELPATELTLYSGQINEIVIEINLEEKTIAPVIFGDLSYIEETSSLMYYYIGQIDMDGIIHQEWQGGIIYRNTQSTGFEIVGDLAYILQLRDADGVTVLEWNSSGIGEPGAIVLDGQGNHTMWPLATCPVIQEQEYQNQ